MPDRLDSEEALFFAATTRPPAERQALLADLRRRDPSQAERLAVLLAAHESGFALDSPVALGPTLTLQPGDRIGPFTLRQRIGEGGVGEVYLAEQTQPFRRTVALKVLKPGMDTREVVARFESERQALALMDHPNIARVYDAGTTPQGFPFFAMEFVDGRPISRFCLEQRLTLPDRLTLFVKVCHGIQHAHDRGVIHRDIKSSNVLVRMVDGEPVPKVIDFGIAKATEFRLTEKTLHTQVAELLGTPTCMSPEQSEGRALDPRTDVYSLGVLLYELVVGRPPFAVAGAGLAAVDELRRRIREEPAPSLGRVLGTLAPAVLADLAAQRQVEPADLLPRIRGKLEWIALRCVEKAPARRYPSARALADDINRYLHAERIEATPPAALSRLRTRVQTHRAAQWLGAATAAAIEGFATRRARQQPPPAPVAALPRGATLAVLPFTYAEGRHDYVSDGITDEVLMLLAKVPGLRVTARSASLQFRESAIPPDQIARSLGVAFLLEGTIARTGDRVRLAATLLEAAGGKRVWSQTFERAWTDLVALQDEVVARIAAFLRLGGGPAPRRPVNPEVHRLVLEGRHHWNEFDEPGFHLAEAAFGRALELHPEYPPAIAGLACVWARRAILSFQAAPHIAAILSEADRHSRAALRLDPTLAEAHAALGLVALIRGQLREAEQSLQQAIALNPNSEVAWIYHAKLLQRQGRPDRAIPEMENARLLLPLRGAFAVHLGSAYLESRRLTDALAVCEAAEAAGGATAQTHVVAALALARLGRPADALSRAQTSRDPRLRAEWNPATNTWLDGLAAWALAEAGAADEARALVAQIAAAAPEERYSAGFAVATLGDPARGFALLEGMQQFNLGFLFTLIDQNEPLARHPGAAELLRNLDALEAFDTLRRTLGRPPLRPL